MPSNQRTSDVIVAGAGADGLVAALAARAKNLRTLVVERAASLGDSSSCADGAVWIPDNPVSRAAGVRDSFDAALAYLQAALADGPEIPRARKETFLRHGREMVAFLAEQGFRWRACMNIPDSRPELPGGAAGGRVLEAEVFDARKLGEWERWIASSARRTGLPLYCSEDAALPRGPLASAGAVAWAFGARFLGRLLLGQLPVTRKRALIGQLLYLMRQRSMDLWTEASLVRLIVEADRVVGAVVQRGGVEVPIRAERGVLLTASELRRDLLDQPMLGAARRPLDDKRGHDGGDGSSGPVVRELVTDEQARVLRPDGSPILGLYATSLVEPTALAHTSPGPGAPLGAAMTFAYLAVQAMARAADTAVLRVR